MDTTKRTGGALPADMFATPPSSLTLTAAERSYVRDTLFELVGLDGLAGRFGEPITRRDVEFARRCVEMVDAVGVVGETGDAVIANPHALARLRELVAEDTEFHLNDDPDTRPGVDGRDEGVLVAVLSLERKLGIDRALLVRGSDERVTH